MTAKILIAHRLTATPEEETQEEQRLKNVVCLLGELQVATTVN